MLAVTGVSTSIVKALCSLTGEKAVRIRCNPSMHELDCTFDWYEWAPGELVTGYVLAAGVIHPTALADQTAAQVQASLTINLGNTLRLAEFILGYDQDARIAIIGSASAHFGSFDALYAACKAGLHGYVQFRKTRDSQQLIAIAPPLIADSGMVQRRHDWPEVLKERRSVTSRAVAQAILEAWEKRLRGRIIWL
jgi:NAD(P)-dependent dehydrogenase (short-subunit alcohol dehydrogenase family)